MSETEKEVFDPKLDNIDVEYDLDSHIHALLLSEPFFARVSRYVTKWASYTIPTVGVRINKDSLNFEMIYNPKFFKELKNDEERRAILMHEFYHIALAHCTGRRKEDVPHKIQNIAMDLAINGLPNMINILPEGGCIPGKGMFKDLPPGHAFEWYLAKLQDMAEEQEQGEGEGQPGDAETLDDHSGWDGKDAEGKGAQGEDDNAKQIAEQKLKDVIEKAANECDQGSSWGSVSNDMKSTIRNAFTHKLDPKVLFRHFCNASIRSSKKHRITKINKRWPMVHPGRVWERRANVAIAIDQSGSVSNEMLETVYGWMNELASLVDFTVIPFDSGVFEDKVFVWKKGQKKTRERVLQGGTDFNAPTKYINEKRKDIDGLVIFTDLEAPTPVRCKVKRIWITDQYHARNRRLDTKEKILIID